MSGQIEQQLRDYFADLDASQRSVDVAAIAANQHAVDVPTLDRIDVERAPRRRQRRALLLAAAVVIVVCIALVVNQGQRQAVEIVPGEPGPGASVESSIPNVLRMTCPENRPGYTEGGRPTLESPRVALQRDGLHVEVAPHVGEPLYVWVTSNFRTEAVGATKPGEVSRFVVGSNLLTDLEPSAVELSVACGYRKPIPAPHPEFFNDVALDDSASVWSLTAGGCRGHAVVSDTVNVQSWGAQGSVGETADWLSARTPGFRGSDSIESTESGFDVVRDGTPVARWYPDPPTRWLLVSCPASGIGSAS
jgi:hypothetical protein